MNTEVAPDSKWQRLTSLQMFLFNAGLGLATPSFGLNPYELRRHVELFDKTLDPEKSHWIRGSGAAASAFVSITPSNTDAVHLHYFLAGITDHHDRFRQLAQQGPVELRKPLAFYRSLTQRVPNIVDLYVSPIEYQRIREFTKSDEPENVSEEHFSNGVDALWWQVDLNIGTRGLVFVNESKRSSDNRAGISERQDASRARMIRDSEGYVIEMTDKDKRRLTQPEKINESALKWLPGMQQLLQVARATRFSSATPDPEVGYYPQALRLPDTVMGLFGSVLHTMKPEYLTSERHRKLPIAAAIASEFTAAFFYHPPTTLRLLQQAHPKLFPYLNRGAINDLLSDPTLLRITNSRPWLVTYPRQANQQFDITSMLYEMITPEARQLVIELAKLDLLNIENQECLNWSMEKNPAAYYIPGLAFCTQRLR